MNGIEHLQDWYRRVVELGPLWRSLRLTCICLRYPDGWISVSGRLELSLEEPTGDEVRPIVELDELAALSGRLSINALPQVVSTLETGLIPLGTAYHPVKLPSAGVQSGQCQWFEPRLWDRRECESGLGVGFASLISQYSDSSATEPIPQQLRYGIDQKLKMADRPFNGIDGLSRSLGLEPLAQSGQRWFRCVSPIPLRFGVVSQELRDQRLSVVVEAAPTVELPEAWVNVFVGDGAIRLGFLSEWEAVREGDPSGKGAGRHTLFTRYRKAVDLGPHVASLRLALAYKGTVADEREQFLSPRDPWLRACQYFDPELARSKKLLNSQGSNNINNLELGVVRLLAIAGFRVTWFGKESAGRKRDILAYYESDGGRKTFVVVECTEVDPARKIDKTAASAKELDAWLGDPSCEVVPIVVTAATLKDVDLKAAFQAGVRLAGADELEDAWQAVERGSDPANVLQALIKIDLMKHPSILDL